MAPQKLPTPQLGLVLGIAVATRGGVEGELHSAQLPRSTVPHLLHLELHLIWTFDPLTYSVALTVRLGILSGLGLRKKPNSWGNQFLFGS